MMKSGKEVKMNKTILKQIGMEREVARMERGLCPTCGKEINLAEFYDELSLKELSISGMCQSCQDSVFGGGE